ncbi:NUDIX domain-containing protein [Labrys neptuniae]
MITLSVAAMQLSEKACPIVVRTQDRHVEVLAFIHPLAGRQFVKGTIVQGEPPLAAAKRELREESGLIASSPMESLGVHLIGAGRQKWHFFRCLSSGLPERWQHAADDDLGHVFSFFWHPLNLPLDQEWHPIFHEAFAFFAPRLAREWSA